MTAETYPSFVLCLSLRCGNVCVYWVYPPLLMTCLGLAIMEHLIRLKNSPSTYLIIIVDINNFQEVLFYPSFSCFSENSLIYRSCLSRGQFCSCFLWRNYGENTFSRAYLWVSLECYLEVIWAKQARSMRSFKNHTLIF